MNDQTSDKIKNIMSTIFNVDKSAINDDSSPETVETWDSLQHMNMIVALEEEFGIIFNDDQITSMLDFKSVSEAVQYNLK
ncbi:MAG: acyl carrier protein [Bacteroidia bacterium]